MEELCKYIDSIYKHMDQSSDEVQAMKQEMKSHLIQTVEELKLQGKSEEEAIKIAINRFGDKEQVGIELEQIFKLQRKFAKTFLKVVLSFLFISALCIISTLLIHVYTDNITSKRTATIESQIIDVFKQQGLVSDKAVNTVFNKYNNNIRYIAIVKIQNQSDEYKAMGDILSSESEMVEYVYPKDLSPEQTNGIAIGAIFTSKDGSQHEYHLGLVDNFVNRSYDYESAIYHIALICLGIYWVLFGIWASINAYHLKRLNAKWVVIFLICNVLGYMIFKSDKKGETY